MSEINVLKFGGTSMGSAQAMRQSAKVSLKQKANLVVVSAMSGITNEIITLANAAERQESEQVALSLSKITEKHVEALTDLGAEAIAKTQLERHLKDLQDLARGIFCEAR